MRHQHRRFFNPDRPAGAPDLRAQFEILNPRFKLGTDEASKKMRELGVRHLLIGGMAVGAYATPRATKDIDFLVGPEAWLSHGVIVSMVPGLPYEAAGIAVDSMLAPHQIPGIEESLARGVEDEGIPIAPIEVLILMKLVAARLQDRADIDALLDHADVDIVRRYVAQYGPGYLPAFKAAVDYKIQRRQEDLAERLSRGEDL